MKLPQDPSFNWAYLYGLSDFWNKMFSDPELFGGLYNATTVQMAKAYSKFLALTSGISLTDVQVNAGTEVELVTLLVPFGSEDDLTLELDKPITNAEFLNDRPILPNVSLESGVEFDIDQVDADTFRITFSKPISEYGFPYRETSEGLEYALWATDCTLDEGLIYSQYAKTIRIDPEQSTNIYKDYIRGLYFLFTQGPNLAYMEQGINLAIGVPVARTSEVVFLTTFDPQQGTWVVVTNKNSYVLPYGIEPSVSRGDVLEQGDSIANVVSIEDFTSDGAWWLNIFIPATILPGGQNGSLGVSGAVATEGSAAFELMARYLKTHTFLVRVLLAPGAATGNFDTLRTLINKVKPSYTLGIYSWSIPLGEEIIDLEDEEDFAVQPTLFRDDFVGFPAHHDRSILSVYPGNIAKTTRGTDRWFIKGNYTEDGRNVFNTPSDRVVAPFKLSTSEYLGTVGPALDSTKVVILSKFESFLSDGIQRTFALGYVPISRHSLHVYVNGVYHSKDSYYVYENNITLYGNVPAESRIDVVYLSGSNLISKTFQVSGDGVSTSFSLPYIIPNDSFVLAYERGIATQRGKFSVSGNTLTFQEPILEGTNNLEIVVFETTAVDIPTVFIFSGDGVQNSFDLLDTELTYLNLQVFINGVYQEKIRYTVNAGVVTFNQPPVSGVNNVEIISTQNMAPQVSLLGSRKDSFSGDGVTTDFLFDYLPISKDTLRVFISGVRQSPSTYLLLPGNSTIRFVEPPPAGSFNIEIIYLVGDEVEYNFEEFSGDGITTTFTPSFTIPDEFCLTVYIRGVHQLRSAYELVGNSIVFVEAPDVGVDNIQIVTVFSPLFRSNVAVFSTDGINKDFDIGIDNIPAQYVDVYFKGIYQHRASYTYNEGVVTFYEAPYAATDSLEIIISNYEVNNAGVVSAMPMYNLKEAEVRAKLSDAGVMAPPILPNRFAIYRYTAAPSLDTRDGTPLPVAQGLTYYSAVSDVYLDNLLNVDSNGQTPETHLSYAFSNQNTGIMLFQRCADRLDLWTAFSVGTLYTSLYFPVPEEDPLGIFQVPV